MNKRPFAVEVRELCDKNVNLTATTIIHSGLFVFFGLGALLFAVTGPQRETYGWLLGGWMVLYAIHVVCTSLSLGTLTEKYRNRSND